MNHLIREVAVTYRGQRRALPAVTGPTDVARFVRSTLNGDGREYFIAIYLDGRHRPISYQVVSIGTATASLVHPREIFQAAIHAGACGLIIAHNHPSGDETPSADDRVVTKRIADAGKLLGIPVLDHVIVGSDSHYSMQESAPELLNLD